MLPAKANTFQASGCLGQGTRSRSPHGQPQNPVPSKKYLDRASKMYIDPEKTPCFKSIKLPDVISRRGAVL